MLARLIGGPVALHAARIGKPAAILTSLHAEGVRMAVITVQRMIARGVTVHAARVLQHSVDIEERLRGRTLVSRARQSKDRQ